MNWGNTDWITKKYIKTEQILKNKSIVFKEVCRKGNAVVNSFYKVKGVWIKYKILTKPGSGLMAFPGTSGRNYVKPFGRDISTSKLHWDVTKKIKTKNKQAPKSIK